VPFIERVIPKEWISPIAVQHTVESHMNEAKPTNTANGQTQNQTQTQTSSTTTSTTNKRPESESVWSSIFSNLDRLEQK
jgi:hypothetical protein